jgi:hypothetical protein
VPDTRRDKSALQTLFADNTSGDISANDARDGWETCHPANVVQSAAFSSEPASGQVTGDLFLPTDTLYAERYSGSSWQPWGPMWPLTKPPTSGWSWLNQGSATIDDSKGFHYVEAPSNSGANGVRARLRSAPTPPYTITALLSCQFDISSVGYLLAGLCWTNGTNASTSLIHAAQFEPNATVNPTIFKSFKYDNASTGNSNYIGTTYAPGVSGGVPFWLRIADDNTNRIISVSADGFNWIAIHSVSRTNFLTATHVGFFNNPFSAKSGVTLLSWKEA